MVGNGTMNPPGIAGLSLRQAALVAGFGLLVMIGTPVAEFKLLPGLFVPENPAASIRNVLQNRGMLAAAIIGFTVTFVADIVVSWALYALFAPVNRAVSMLAAWMRLVYTVIAFVGVLKLVAIYRVLANVALVESFDPAALESQVQMLYLSFRYDWSYGLIVFGLHLCLLGYLAWRAAYVPRYVGALLVVAGAGYVIYDLGPFIAPGTDLGWMFVTFFGELVFMFWLLIRGWFLQDPMPGAGSPPV